jgi:hypothetical protein
MTLHKPVRFDWVAEVNEAFGLSPVAHNTPQPMSVDPAPVFPNNPVPDNAIVNPVCTMSTNATTSKPIASTFVNPNPTGVVPTTAIVTDNGNPTTYMPVQHTHITFENPVPTDPTPVTPTPTNPIPSDVAIDPVHTMFASTVPVDPDLINPSPIATDNCNPTSNICVVFANHMPVHPMHASALPVNCSPVAPTPIDHVLCDMAIDPVCTVLTSAVPVDPNPINTNSVTLCKNENSCESQVLVKIMVF